MKRGHSSRIMPAFFALVALLALCGCTENVIFGSQSPLGNGVLGKTWQAPYFVDGSLYIPSPQGASISSTPAGVTGGLNWDFSAAASGDTLELVGSWWDASTALPFDYRGYARKYKDGVGWSSLGPDFGQIAADSNNSFSSASVAAGPGGLFMANFFDGVATGDTASASYAGTSWQQYANNVATPLRPVPGSTIASVMDSLGRGYVFYVDNIATAPGTYLHVRETQWGLASAHGMATLVAPYDASGVRVSVAGATAASPDYTSPITARFDGKTQVCGTFEADGGTGAPGTLMSSCQDVACAPPFSFGNTATIDSLVSGHDTATDGAGTIVAVYAKNTGSAFHIFSKFGTVQGSCADASAPVESWSAATQIDTQGSDVLGTFVAAHPGGIKWQVGMHPGVAYVGAGRYLAVWIGDNTSTALPSTQIYSSLYTPTGGWSTPSAVSNTYEGYLSIPHPQLLTVFGNGLGNAGFAINKIVTTDLIPAPSTTTGTSIYPEYAQVRSILLDRWQEDSLWTPLISFAPGISGGVTTTPGFTCYNQLRGTQAAGPFNASADPASGAQLDCNHAPVGVILPSGDSLVFFQMQDNFPQPGPGGTIIPGNRGVAVTEFR